MTISDYSSNMGLDISKVSPALRDTFNGYIIRRYSKDSGRNVYMMRTNSPLYNNKEYFKLIDIYSDLNNVVMLDQQKQRLSSMGKLNIYNIGQ